MQGDSVFNLLQGVRVLLARFRELRDEERYYETLMIVETLYWQLQHYEETLASRGMELPYSGSVSDNPIHDDFEDTSTTG